MRDLEDELRDLREDVSQGTTAKADFLANISHELRTPVTVAKGIAYVLRNPSVPEVEREQFLEQLQESLDRLVGSSTRSSRSPSSSGGRSRSTSRRPTWRR